MSALRSSCRRGRGRARCAYVSRVLAALILIAPSLIADRAIAYAAPPPPRRSHCARRSGCSTWSGSPPGWSGGCSADRRRFRKNAGTGRTGCGRACTRIEKARSRSRSCAARLTGSLTGRPPSPTTPRWSLTPSASNTPCRRSRMNMCSGGSRPGAARSPRLPEAGWRQLPLRARTHEAVTLPPSASASTEAGLRDWRA